MNTFLRLALPLFSFSAIALATACGGGKADPAADATKVADQAPASSFDLTAKSNKFNQKILVANANAEIKVSLSNQDGGTLHNFAVYKDKSAKENLYRGESFEGTKTVDDDFRSPEPGIYFFRCDVHPDSMTGTLVTK
jgi:plastocyanin